MESGGMTAFPRGEDQTSFRRRCVDGVKSWIDRLLEECADSVAFIVHGGTIMAVFSELAEDKYEFYHYTRSRVMWLRCRQKTGKMAGKY